MAISHSESMPRPPVSSVWNESCTSFLLPDSWACARKTNQGEAEGGRRLSGRQCRSLRVWRSFRRGTGKGGDDQEGRAVMEGRGRHLDDVREVHGEAELGVGADEVELGALDVGVSPVATVRCHGLLLLEEGRDGTGRGAQPQFGKRGGGR